MKRTCSTKRIWNAMMLAAALAAPALATSALASDLAPPARPYAKAPPAAAAYDWSGFYAGAHVGFDWGRTRIFDNGVLAESSVPMNGAIGGLLAGINWQSGAFVYGLEADFGASALRGRGARPVATPDFVANQYNVDISGHLRGRIGYAVAPQTLLFAAGGLAVASFEFRDAGGPDPLRSTMVGWTAGGGVDQALSRNLIGRIEYLYADYGNTDFNVGPGDVYNAGFRSQTLRAALIGKFDTDGKPAAMNAMASAGPITNWSGFYIGGDIGGAWQHGSGTTNYFQDASEASNDNPRSLSTDLNAVIGGFHAGYNWQVAPSFVLGFEGDHQWTRARYGNCRPTDDDNPVCLDQGRGIVTISGETRSISTVRGRLGISFDRVMIYGTGGAAFADIQTLLGVDCQRAGCGANSAQFAQSVNSSVVKSGWVAGAGIEWMLTANWIARTEYLHADFGTLSDRFNLSDSACNIGFGGPCGVSWSRRLDYDIVRAGISYKFGG